MQSLLNPEFIAETFAFRVGNWKRFEHAKKPTRRSKRPPNKVVFRKVLSTWAVWGVCVGNRLRSETRKATLISSLMKNNRIEEVYSLDLWNNS